VAVLKFVATSVLLMALLPACSIAPSRPNAGYFTLPASTSVAAAVQLVDDRRTQQESTTIEPSDGFSLRDADFRPTPMSQLGGLLQEAIEVHADAAKIHSWIGTQPIRVTRFRAEVAKTSPGPKRHGSAYAGMPAGTAAAHQVLESLSIESERKVLATLDVEVNVNGVAVSAYSSEPYDIFNNRVYEQLLREVSRSLAGRLAREAKALR
jgi:hypothetical protein